MKRIIRAAIALAVMAALAATGAAAAEGEWGGRMARLTYQGHGSFRIETAGGVVIYVDPYAGDGYDLPADIVLVTHQHGDHNRVDLPAKREDCAVIANAEALEGGTHNRFELKGVAIEAVEAYNKNHDVKACVGYLIEFDGLLIYAAGDTSTTARMAELAERGIDYALLPCDGVYNMDLAEAAECARLIGARFAIPIHLKPGALFDRARAEAFDAPNRLIVEAGEAIDLVPKP